VNETTTLAQRLSEEFINAQNSMERTVQELRLKSRALSDRLQQTISDLETARYSADVDQLVGLSEEAMGIERLGRLLVTQRELLEAALDNTRAVTRRRLT
jgi:hypothetical protein